MRFREFVRQNKVELDQYIQQFYQGTLNNDDRYQWCINDEFLYNWARSEGVKL